jgi:AcrR family transcriptional regulator
MSARETRKIETIRRILDAAAQAFAAAGFEGARIDDIANRAGVNKAMIYYHIGDKKALYTRVLHDVFGDTAARLAANLEHAASPTEKIKAYIHSIFETIERHPHLPPVMMREMAAGGVNLPEIVAGDLALIIGTVARLLSEGRECGEFEAVHPFVLHMMVVGGFSFFKTSGPARHRHAGLMTHTVGKPGDEETMDLENEVEKIVLNAVSK